MRGDGPKSDLSRSGTVTQTMRRRAICMRTDCVPASFCRGSIFGAFSGAVLRRVCRAVSCCVTQTTISSFSRASGDPDRSQLVEVSEAWRSGRGGPAALSKRPVRPLQRKWPLLSTRYTRQLIMGPWDKRRMSQLRGEIVMVGVSCKHLNFRRLNWKVLTTCCLEKFLPEDVVQSLFYDLYRVIVVEQDNANDSRPI